MKNIKDISLDISEEEYRQMPELSYSTLAKYERGGFNSLPTLCDKVESPSLTFGSCVDSIITGGQEEFDARFIVAEFPDIPDSIVNILKILHKYPDAPRSLDRVPDAVIIAVTEHQKYQLNWKPETRAKVIKEKGEEYYNLLTLAEDKTIINTETYNDVLKAVEVLKNSEATKWYFSPDNPFDNIERHYQLKFRADLHDVGYRCMMDLLIVDHNNKTLQPIDLKTSYKPEYDFYKSFIEWNYQLQNRLYYRILKANVEKDDYFKDFKILPYKDIVVCRTSLNPLVWDCDFTYDSGTLVFGKNSQIEMRDPEEIGQELKYYLDTEDKVPLGINVNTSNDLRKWLDRL